MRTEEDQLCDDEDDALLQYLETNNQSVKNLNKNELAVKANNIRKVPAMRAISNNTYH